MSRGTLAALLCTALPATAETLYKQPASEVVEIVDAAPTPQALLSPRGDALMLATPEAHPPIAFLAQPVLRVTGVRIAPATGARQPTLRYSGIELRRVDGGAVVRVALPDGPHARRDDRMGEPMDHPERSVRDPSR